MNKLILSALIISLAIKFAYCNNQNTQKINYNHSNNNKASKASQLDLISNGVNKSKRLATGFTSIQQRGFKSNNGSKKTNPMHVQHNSSGVRTLSLTATNTKNSGNSNNGRNNISVKHGNRTGVKGNPRNKTRKYFGAIRFKRAWDSVTRYLVNLANNKYGNSVRQNGTYWRIRYNTTVTSTTVNYALNYYNANINSANNNAYMNRNRNYAQTITTTTAIIPTTTTTASTTTSTTTTTTPAPTTTTTTPTTTTTAATNVTTARTTTTRRTISRGG